MQVRNLMVRRLEAEDSFDLLVDEMGRHYSFFAHKEIAWRGPTHLRWMEVPGKP